MDHWTPLKFSGTEGSSYYCESSYDDIVASFGYQVVGSEWVGSDQGDALFLLYDTDKKEYGFLSVGYGSCSGCDALLACSSKAEVESLRSSIHSDIKWMAEERTWDVLCANDTEGKFYGIDPEAEEFIVKRLMALPVPWMSDTTKAMLSNIEADPEILADSLEEDGLRDVPRMLRDKHVKDQVLVRIRRVLGIEPKESAK